MLGFLGDFLFPPRPDEQLVREVSPEALRALLSPQEIRTTMPHTIGLLPFHDVRVRALVHEAKYHGNARAFSLLALALRTFLETQSEKLRSFDSMVFVPIPLGEARRRERGYNQVEEVVRRVKNKITDSESKPLCNAELLVRTRETVSQVTLHREERIQNMRGAFRIGTSEGKLGAAHALDPNVLYILLDDVITTGATLQAGIDALCAAGAKHLLPIALSY